MVGRCDPHLTAFEIVGFNVYEILPKSSGSAIAADKSLYVLDVPDSERAPHQSTRDLKYYVRLGGKSRPATHRIIEDIRNRGRHPRLEVHDMHLRNATFLPGPLGTEGQLHLTLEFCLRNNGKVRAANACLKLSANIPVSMDPIGGTEFFPRSATLGTLLLEVRNPVYPGMGVMMTPPIKMAADVRMASLTTVASLVLGGLGPDEAMKCCSRSRATRTAHPHMSSDSNSLASTHSSNSGESLMK